MTAAAAKSGKARVTRLKIEKFRAIGAADVELGDTVALVGQNGAGKSSVLRALNAFFNVDDEREDFESGRHACTKTSQALIEVTLTGLKGAGLLTTQSGGEEVRARLKFKKAAVWECAVGSKWQTAPPNLHEVLQKHIAFARAVEEWITHNRQRDPHEPTGRQGRSIPSEAHALGPGEATAERWLPTKGRSTLR